MKLIKGDKESGGCAGKKSIERLQIKNKYVEFLLTDLKTLNTNIIICKE